MHPNRKFHVDDRERLAAFVREQGFGTIVAPIKDGLCAVHVPLLIEGDRLRFHVSRNNRIHAGLLGGGEALLIVNGPHAYVSPDWYGLDDRVPTWNYAAVELEGRIVPMDREALIRLLDHISDHHEAKLAPKPVWTRDKMSDGRFQAMLEAITGFEMQVTAWRGTFKLDQDKPAEVRSRLAAALEAHGETAIAGLMRP